MGIYKNDALGSLSRGRLILSFYDIGCGGRILMVSVFRKTNDQECLWRASDIIRSGS